MAYNSEIKFVNLLHEDVTNFLCKPDKGKLDPPPPTTIKRNEVVTIKVVQNDAEGGTEGKITGQFEYDNKAANFWVTFKCHHGHPNSPVECGVSDNDVSLKITEHQRDAHPLKATLTLDKD